MRQRKLTDQANKEPTIGKFLDDEEREIFEAIGAEAYVPVSIMTPESKVKYQEIKLTRLVMLRSRNKYLFIVLCRFVIFFQ